MEAVQSRQSDGGLNVGFTLSLTFTSTPELLNTHAAPPVDLSMGQGSNGPQRPWCLRRGGIIAISGRDLSKFSRDRRDYWRWKAEWESIQAQAEPMGSRECKKPHLLDSIDEVVKSELRLLRCREANDIFRELENHYGDKAQTAKEIMLEL